MKKAFSLISILFLIFCIISCEDEKSPEIIYFSNDKSLLAEQNTDFKLGIKFNPPQNWDLRSTEISRKIENRQGFRGERVKFVYSPSHVYFDDSTTSVLSLGRVEPPDSLKGRSGLLNYYSQILISKPGSENEQKIAQFMKDGIRFSQFTIEKGSIISKRLIFQNKFDDIIQFEYTSKTSMFDLEYEKIKQSIGSIELL